MVPTSWRTKNQIPIILLKSWSTQNLVPVVAPREVFPLLEVNSISGRHRCSPELLLWLALQLLGMESAYPASVSISLAMFCHVNNIRRFIYFSNDKNIPATMQMIHESTTILYQPHTYLQVYVAYTVTKSRC